MDRRICCFPVSVWAYKDLSPLPQVLFLSFPGPSYYGSFHSFIYHGVHWVVFVRVFTCGHVASAFSAFYPYCCILYYWEF